MITSLEEPGYWHAVFNVVHCLMLVAVCHTCVDDCVPRRIQDCMAVPNLRICDLPCTYCQTHIVSHSALTGSFSVYHVRRQLFLAQFCSSDRPLAESRLRSQTSIVSELESMIHPGHVMVLASLGGAAPLPLCPYNIPLKLCQVWTDAHVNPC